jgi:Zn-dependent protease
VLYALGDPLSFVLLIVSFLVAVTLHGWVQAVFAARADDRQAQRSGRTRPDPRRHVDPFGAIAGAIAGLGWPKPVEVDERAPRRALLTVLLSGVVVNAVVGAAALAAFSVLSDVSVLASTAILQRGLPLDDLLARGLLLFGLMNVFVAALSLVPLPPLGGGRILFAYAPRTPGWQKARYHLVEQNIGVAVLLALLIIPLGGPQALLPSVLDTLVGPLLDLVTRG